MPIFNPHNLPLNVNFINLDYQNANDPYTRTTKFINAEIKNITATKLTGHSEYRVSVELRVRRFNSPDDLDPFTAYMPSQVKTFCNDLNDINDIYPNKMSILQITKELCRRILSTLKTDYPILQDYTLNTNTPENTTLKHNLQYFQNELTLYTLHNSLSHILPETITQIIFGKPIHQINKMPPKQITTPIKLLTL